MNPVTLRDGRAVDSSSEDWRAECEARQVCDMASLYDRRIYIGLVAKKRGDAAAERLKKDIAAFWNSR